MRCVLAARVAHGITLGGHTLAEAVGEIVHGEMKALGAQGGLIAVTAQAEIVMAFNTAGMFRAWVEEGQSSRVAIW